MIISFAESALGDLEEVQAWYAEQGVPGVGARLTEEVFRNLLNASRPWPTILIWAGIVPEFDQPFLRELIHPPFRIVYRRDPQRLRIVRVWRSERLLLVPSDSDEGSSMT